MNTFNYDNNEFNLEYKLVNCTNTTTKDANLTANFYELIDINGAGGGDNVVNDDDRSMNDTISINTGNILFNLHDILLYSPFSIIDLNYEKLLFLFYQLLKIIQLLHNLNINCSNLKLNNLYINKNYWLKVRLPFKDILNLYETCMNNVVTSENNINESVSSSVSLLIKQNILFKQELFELYDSYKQLNTRDLVKITIDWHNGKLDNFNYLLILNCLAGRKLNCPYNHPIFPWIIDFKDNKIKNLRDLNKTKYRLNKSDPHLDFTYQESSASTTPNISNSNGVAYHLIEFLSEITYFVYKSRITDKDTLCRHVRTLWVTNILRVDD